MDETKRGKEQSNIEMRRRRSEIAKERERENSERTKR